MNQRSSTYEQESKKPYSPQAEHRAARRALIELPHWKTWRLEKIGSSAVWALVMN